MTKDAEDREWLRTHGQMCRVLMELLPMEPAGDVYDLTTRLVERGVSAEAVSAAFALGGVAAVTTLSYSEKA